MFKNKFVTKYFSSYYRLKLFVTFLFFLQFSLYCLEIYWIQFDILLESNLISVNSTESFAFDFKFQLLYYIIIIIKNEWTLQWQSTY